MTLQVMNAAVLFHGMIFTMPRPNRHTHIVHLMYGLGVPPTDHANAGDLFCRENFKPVRGSVTLSRKGSY